LNICLFILLILLIFSTYAFTRDKRLFDLFTQTSETTERQKFYRKWSVELILFYGLPALLILWYLGKLHVVNELPSFLRDIPIDYSNSFISGLVQGLGIGLVFYIAFQSVIKTLFEKWFDKNSPPTSDIPDSIDILALIPRNYKERWWGAILSINAGIWEELFFRILLPILIYEVTNSVVTAIVLSTLWFGFAHYYQGMQGVISTFVIGLFLFGFYIITQNIWLTILFHVVIDLNAFVLNPWLKQRNQRM